MLVKTILAMFVLICNSCTTAKIIGRSSSPSGMSQITLRYSTKGGESFVKARKDDAIAKAKSYCNGGQVKVTSESIESDNHIQYDEQFAVIVFECLDKKADSQVY